MPLHGPFQPYLFFLPVLIGVLAAYTAFAFTDAMTSSTGRHRRLWIWAGAITMGFGMWSIPYVGMLAAHAPTTVQYHLPLVALSLIAAILISGAALVTISERPRTRSHFAVGSALLGCGIVAMHYSGIAAMRINAAPRFHFDLLALSIVVSVSFSALAIKVGTAIHGNNRIPSRTTLVRVTGAILMGLGIAGSHALDVMGLHFTTAPTPASSVWMIGISSIGAIGIAGTAGLMLIVALLSTSVDRHLAHEEALKTGLLLQLQEANALRAAIVDSALLAIISTDREGVIRSVNRAAEQMLGYSSEELIGKVSLTELHDQTEIEEQAIRMSVQLKYGIPADLEAIVASSGNQKLDDREWTYICKDGRRIPVRLSVSVLYGPAREEQGYLVIAQDISAQKNAEHSVRHLALHDPLTGLPNRMLLEEQIVRSLALASRHDMQVALAVIDLDRFKHINDTLGRQTGDEILLTIARRLTDVVRASDMVVRLGSDEFAVLMPGIEHPRQSMDTMARVQQVLSEAIHVTGMDLYVTPSIGISAFPGDGHDLNTLLRKAGRAMNKAKSQGRNAVAIFSSDLEKEESSLLVMESALHRAIKHNEFFLVYQPVFHMSSGRIIGVEALLRWQQPDGNTLMPADFIPLAEETGLIRKIGERVLRTACSQLGIFSRAAGSPLTMAVNISSSQFRESELIETVRDTLASTGIAYNQLELEITESVLLDENEEAKETIRRIRSMGVQIVMDDFGTGYSSLSYLKRFPIDRLKIDRSFVTGMESAENDLALTSAIIKMGHSLNAKVTAEGVETARQWQVLCEQGCDDAQGFHLAKPMRAEQMVEYLLGQSPRAVRRVGEPAHSALHSVL